jgi:ABC-type uncharacterized transport system auxiliary subunit
LQKQSFAFAALPFPQDSESNREPVGRPSAGTPSAASHSPQPTLLIRRVTVAVPFDSQSFIYRTGELSYERDPYADFLVAPSEAVDAALRGYLQESGAFQAVVEPGSALTPSLQLEAEIEQLYGDFRNPTAPAAVLQISFRFYNASNDIPQQVLLEKQYAHRTALKTRTAAAVMAGWNEGLNEIVKQTMADWQARNRARTPEHRD